MEKMGTHTPAQINTCDPQGSIAAELSRLDGARYLEDIKLHTKHMEDLTLPDVSFIDMQREIQWHMRPCLIDFLVKAHTEFSLLPETLFLTVNVLDRYCSKRVVYRSHYQLVGCTSLLIASKYSDEKANIPQICELNRICCGKYDDDMFTQMEMHILNTLGWLLGHPTVGLFSQLMVVGEGDDPEVESMAAYISEVALYYRDFVSTKPSTIARCSLVLARTILRHSELESRDFSGVEMDILRALVTRLPQPSKTLRNKYSGERLHGVSRKLADFVKANWQRNSVPGSPVTLPVQRSDSDTPQKRRISETHNGYPTPGVTPKPVCSRGTRPAEHPIFWSPSHHLRDREESSFPTCWDYGSQWSCTILGEW
ncbi:cyclin-like protein [Dactylonectria macrodidyma]|uniref:Cyclin-like protein n=1 Tax=Dactylonectria macrodidyma TaxID=307937 RepID=A0A9P9I6J7_9HYPO|nr:cyclin-like protein [Dactylonectria macrodidyma]